MPSNSPSQPEYTVLTIRSADEAWSLFEAAIQGEELPENLKLHFEGWPTYQLHFDGQDWDRSVPTRVMAPLIELQRDIHRSYARIKYNSTSLHKLNKEERDSLELVVKVEPGSSNFLTPISGPLNDLATAAIGKMSPHDIVITVLGLALIYGGVEIAKSWIAQRQQAIDSDNRVSLSKEESERLRIFAAAMQRDIVSSAKSEFESTQSDIFKTLKPGDEITTGGVVLPSSEARQIAQTERARSEDIDIRGTFRVLANDASKGAGFRIKVVRISDNLTLTAEVPIELSQEQKNLIQRAEWSKGAVLVDLHITASQLRDTIRDAVVYSASEFHQEE